MLIFSVLNYQMRIFIDLYSLIFFLCTDGCSISAAPGSAVSHLWDRISHAKDPKAIESKFCVSQV
jgi:hypothetical protein